MIHEDGLSQVAVASLLGRHKSWVCRRLALLEKLCDEARHDLSVGLLSPTAARQLVRLPRGNQAAALQTARDNKLSSRELQTVADLLLAAGTRQKQDFVLEKPRQAIRQAEGSPVRPYDPRLSTADRLGHARKTVAKALKTAAPVGYARRKATTTKTPTLYPDSSDSGLPRISSGIENNDTPPCGSSRD